MIVYHRREILLKFHFLYALSSYSCIDIAGIADVVSLNYSATLRQSSKKADLLGNTAFHPKACTVLMNVTFHTLSYLGNKRH